jgi:excisionase family DNA binding protein
MRKLVNFKTASEQTGMAEVTLRKLAARRKLEVVRIGRSVRIPTDALERLTSIAGLCQRCRSASDEA